jgi:hypothetical protein
VVKQMSDDPATEKTGSAENRNEPSMAGCAVCEVFRHGRQPACPPAQFEPSIPDEAERLQLIMLRCPSSSTSSPERLRNGMSSAKLIIVPIPRRRAVPSVA